MPREIQLSLLDLAIGLSETTDFINPVFVNHHSQVAYIAFCLGTELNLSVEQKSELVLSGVLHDIGSHYLKERMDLLQFEVTAPHKHAELGYLLLNMFKPFANIAMYVRHHHTIWNKDVVETLAPFNSYILHLADRVAVLIDKQQDILGQVDSICEKIKKYSGTMFIPEIVNSFLELSSKEYFWLEVTSPSISSILCKIIKLPTIDLSLESLISFSKLFSRIVDFRSRFTVAHSSGVAATAELLAKFSGFSKQECQWMKIAGYLHDIGKLAVPVEILEKPGPLTNGEFNAIRKHPYYTKYIMERIGAFKDITTWVSYHHERLSGSGYPFHVAEENLQLGSRIVAVSDVFTALTEDRPHRKGLSEKAIQEELQRMIDDMSLDSKIVSLLLLHFNEINSARIAAREVSLDEYRKLEYMLTHPE